VHGLLTLRLQGQIVADGLDQVLRVAQVQVEVDLLIAQPPLGDQQCFLPCIDCSLGDDHFAPCLFDLEQDELTGRITKVSGFFTLGFGLPDLCAGLGKIQIEA